MFVAILFYFFSFLILSSALLVITSKNPINSVIFLIFSFFNSAGIFLIAGAEFLALIMLIFADLALANLDVADLALANLAFAYSALANATFAYLALAYVASAYLN